MVTKFDIGQKVYYDLPHSGWGWVEKIVISATDHIVYQVRYPYGEIHYKLESSLRSEYGREKEERK